MTQTQLTAGKRHKEIYSILHSIPRERLLCSNNHVIRSRISARTTPLTSLEWQVVCTTGRWEEGPNLKIATILNQMPPRLLASGAFSPMMNKAKIVEDRVKREASIMLQVLLMAVKSLIRHLPSQN